MLSIGSPVDIGDIGDMLEFFFCFVFTSSPAGDTTEPSM